jgi:hypothetical protein
MFRPPIHAVKSAKTQASLPVGQLVEYQSVRNRNPTIEPPPSRAQDSKIALGNAGAPRVLHKPPACFRETLSPSTAPNQHLNLRRIRIRARRLPSVMLDRRMSALPSSSTRGAWSTDGRDACRSPGSARRTTTRCRGSTHTDLNRSYAPTCFQNRRGPGCDGFRSRESGQAASTWPRSEVRTLLRLL